MKEIHAYKNEDGTYRIEAIGQITDNGAPRDVTIKAARAKITMEVLVDTSSGDLYTVTVEGDEK